MASEKFAEQLDKFVNEKYIPWNKNIKIALAAALIIVPTVLVIFLFYNPKMQEITEREEKRSKLDTEVKEAEAVAANKAHHEKELEKAKQKFEEISVILPKDQEIPALLRNISDLGKRAGLDFLSFAPGNENPKNFYAEIPIRISIRGPYHNVGYFLGEVSGLERLVTVDNISMSGPQEVDGDMMLNSSCNLLTYRYTGQQATPPPGAPQQGKK
ncbi:type 4a pilus biogenesis protein PilO [Desulfobulbus sp. F4]|nr:type 4a pilus biogenesis protein PilO [Desulfobulbus sp. F3]MCW5200508.1 type 4a pilus biogenesis protein PilO [Desulfobulbus sp. F4]